VARLAIRCPGQAETVREIQGSVISIGRGQRSDICIPDQTLSRSHCRLERIGMGYRIVDLGSQNGTKVNGRRIQCPQMLMSGDVITIGYSQILFVADLPAEEDDNIIDPGQTILLEEVDADVLELPKAAKNVSGRRYVLQYFKGGEKKILPLGQEAITIGRHKSCGLVLPDPSVSACHARIDFEAGQYIIRDLGSTNGVLVNGQKFKAKALRPGMRIRLGKVSLGFKEVVSRAEILASPPAPPPEEEQSRTPPLLMSKSEAPSAAKMKDEKDDTAQAESPLPPSPLLERNAAEEIPRSAIAPPASSDSDAPLSLARRSLIIRLAAIAALLLGLLAILLLPSGEQPSQPDPSPRMSKSQDGKKTTAVPPKPSLQPPAQSPAPIPSPPAPVSPKPPEDNGEVIF